MKAQVLFGSRRCSRLFFRNSRSAGIALWLVLALTASADWITLQVPLSRAGHAFSLWEVDGSSPPDPLMRFPGDNDTETAYRTRLAEQVEIFGGNFDENGAWHPDAQAYLTLQVQRHNPYASFWLRDDTAGDFGPRNQTALVFSAWRNPSQTSTLFFAIPDDEERQLHLHEFALYFPSTGAIYGLTKGNIQRTFEGVSLGFFEAWAFVDENDHTQSYQIHDLSTMKFVYGPIQNLVGQDWHPSNGTLPAYEVVFLFNPDEEYTSFTLHVEGGGPQTLYPWRGSFYDSELGVDHEDVVVATASIGQWQRFWVTGGTQGHQSPTYTMGTQRMLADLYWSSFQSGPSDQWAYKAFNFRTTYNIANLQVRHYDGTTAALTAGPVQEFHTWDQSGNVNTLEFFQASTTLDYGQSWWVEHNGVNIGQGPNFYSGWQPWVNTNPPAGSVSNIIPGVRNEASLKLEQEGYNQWQFSIDWNVGPITAGGELGPGGEWVEWTLYQLNSPVSASGDYTIVDEGYGDQITVQPGDSTVTQSWFPLHNLLLKISATRWGNDLRIRTASGSEYSLTPHKVQGVWKLDGSGQTVFNNGGFFDATSTAQTGLKWWLMDYSRYDENYQPVVLGSSDSGVDFTGAIDSTDSDEDGWPDWYERFMGTDPYNPDTDGDGIIDSQDPAPRALAVDPETSTLKVWSPLL